jgi:hypothetical protein
MAKQFFLKIYIYIRKIHFWSVCFEILRAKPTHHFAGGGTGIEATSNPSLQGGQQLAQHRFFPIFILIFFSFLFSFFLFFPFFSF